MHHRNLRMSVRENKQRLVIQAQQTYVLSMMTLSATRTTMPKLDKRLDSQSKQAALAWVPYQHQSRCPREAIHQALMADTCAVCDCGDLPNT